MSSTPDWICSACSARGGCNGHDHNVLASLNDVYRLNHTRPRLEAARTGRSQASAFCLNRFSVSAMFACFAKAHIPHESKDTEAGTWASGPEASIKGPVTEGSALEPPPVDPPAYQPALSMHHRGCTSPNHLRDWNFFLERSNLCRIPSLIPNLEGSLGHDMMFRRASPVTPCQPLGQLFSLRLTKCGISLAWGKTQLLHGHPWSNCGYAQGALELLSPTAGFKSYIC